MNLERYKDKKETRKKVILISLTVLTLVSVTTMLYKTFANFRTSTSFSIMSGKVIYKKKGPDFGIDIPVIETKDGDGLYAVEHLGATSGWEKTEYRYGGKNPNNYVYFNCATLGNESATTCEKWRIIGLVNVKTTDGKMEQRIKIVNPTSLKNLAWDSNGTNDWVRATLMKYLNSNYYSALTASSRDLIEKEISWPLGGVDLTTLSAEQYYEKERGTEVYSGNAAEWNVNTTIDPDTGSKDSSLFRGIGLMYVSDYGFIFGGEDGLVCREDLSFPNVKDTMSADNVCVRVNWIYEPYTNGVFLTHIIEPIGNGTRGFKMWAPFGKAGSMGNSSGTFSQNCIYPSLYISSNYHISHGSGTDTDPYVLG